VTPTETIALTSVVASGLVGLAGILVAGLSGWRDRKTARDLADTERKQTRLANAYVDVLDLSERVGYWASQLQPVDASEDYRPPDPPTMAEQTRVGAKLSAYGSPEVRNLHKTWLKCVGDIVGAATRVRLRLNAAERHQHYEGKPGEDLSWKDPIEPWSKIYDEYLPAEVKAREALTNQVTKELV
jgi:hypothetical protein